jgi:hypothetical protein
MADPPANRCGYTWPPDHEVDDDPNHQSCCWRQALLDADRCAWHADPNKTEEKTIAALQEARSEPTVREQNEPFAELLDGAVLAGCEIGDSILLSRVALRDAYLSGANLSNATLNRVNLRGASLTDATLNRVDLRGANLNSVDMRDANLAESKLQNADFNDSNLEFADFSDCNLINVSFTNALIYKANFSNSKFGLTTSIADVGTYMENDIRASEYHRDIHSLLLESGFVKEAREANHDVQALLAQRRIEKKNNRYLRYFQKTATYFLIKNLNKPISQILAVSTIIASFSIGYILSGLENTSTGVIYTISNSETGFIELFIISLLFSAIQVIEGMYTVFRAIFSIFLDLSALQPIGVSIKESLGVLTIQPRGSAAILAPLQELLGVLVFVLPALYLIRIISLYRAAGPNGSKRTTFLSWLSGK